MEHGLDLWFLQILTERKQQLNVPMSIIESLNPALSPVVKMGDMQSLIQLKEQEVASLREAALQKLEAQVGLNLSA